MAAIRIGFTGHRPNRLSEHHLMTIRSELTSVFKKIHAELANNDLSSLDAKKELILVSGMAAGADLAAIHSAKYLGWRLDLLLPYNRKDFFDTFDSLTDVAEYEQFLLDASNIIEMDIVGLSTSRDVAHEVLGNYLLNHCDVLVAVWDGGESKGKGGTVDIIESAIKKGKPVIWLDTSMSGISVTMSKIFMNNNEVTWTDNLNNELKSLRRFFISN